MTDLTSKNNEWEFKIKTIYEFTINFNDTHQRANTINRMSNVYKILKDNINIKSNISKHNMLYNLKPEISQLQYGHCAKNNMCRIHYHGIILFPTNGTLLNYLINIHQRLTKIGSIQFNEYRPNYWRKYCTKNDLYKKLPRCKNTSWQYINQLASKSKQ